MNTSIPVTLYRIFFALILFTTSSSFAAFIPNPATCSTDKATLEYIYYTDGFPPVPGSPNDPDHGLLSKSYDATSCVGVYGVNDDTGGLNNPSPNIGQYQDGLLNGEDYLSGMEFITPDDLQALDPDGIKDDPGWIHLASFNGDDGSVNYSTTGPVPGGSLVLDIGDLLTLDFTCTAGGPGNCSALDWTLTTKLDIIDQVQELLGEATFDHLAFSVKAGSESSDGGFTVYDFNFKTIFAEENSPYLNFLTPYKLAGTLDTGDFGDKGISHLNVWARDPSDTTDVPEPASMAVFGTGLLAIFYFSRRNRLKFKAT